jgi:hypothetical protein
VTGGSEVEVSTRIAPGFAWARNPSGPSTTARTAAACGSDRIVSGQDSNTPPMRSAIAMPASRARAHRRVSRSKPLTRCPLRMSVAAIGRPMLPRPINPMVVMPAAS